MFATVTVADRSLKVPRKCETNVNLSTFIYLLCAVLSDQKFLAEESCKYVQPVYDNSKMPGES